MMHRETVGFVVAVAAACATPALPSTSAPTTDAGVLASLLAAREALLAEFTIEWTEVDLGLQEGWPDVQELRLVKRGEAIRSDRNVQGGVFDDVLSLDITFAWDENTFVTIVHDDDHQVASVRPVASGIEYFWGMIPNSSFAGVRQFLTPAPRVGAGSTLFDPLALLQSGTATVAAEAEDLGIGWGVKISGEVSGMPVELWVDPARQGLLLRARASGFELRALEIEECHGVWLATRVARAHPETWSVLDAGGEVLAPISLIESSIVRHPDGSLAFSLAADAETLPEDLMSLVPPNFLVYDYVATAVRAKEGTIEQLADATLGIVPNEALASVRPRTPASESSSPPVWTMAASAIGGVAAASALTLRRRARAGS
jgi:hypothetical protein